MPEGLIIRRFVVGPFDTNCYLVWDAGSLDALVIDPGGEISEIAETVREHGLAVKGIVITHAHADHIGGNIPLKKEFDVPIMAHELDADALTDPNKNLAALAGFMGELSPAADRILRDGDLISIGARSFKVLHTPGHTPGGICLLMDEVLFSGDTLFSGSVGRSDFPGGSERTLIASIHAKLMPLSDDTVVYPGHGPNTTIGSERRTNPFI